MPELLLCHGESERPVPGALGVGLIAAGPRPAFVSGIRSTLSNCGGKAPECQTNPERASSARSRARRQTLSTIPMGRATTRVSPRRFSPLRLVNIAAAASELFANRS